MRAGGKPIKVGPLDVSNTIHSAKISLIRSVSAPPNRALYYVAWRGAGSDSYQSWSSPRVLKLP